LNKVLPVILLLLLMLLAGSLNALEYQKKPYKAMLYSAILPGGGQLYNEAYIKTAVVAGLQAYLISRAFYLDGKADHYQVLMDDYAPGEMGYEINKTKRNGYRDDLRSDYWWMGTVLVLSVADAFVDAHLFNYKAEKNKINLKFSDKKLQMEYRF
jgi:hypothetical protein